MRREFPAIAPAGAASGRQNGKDLATRSGAKVVQPMMTRSDSGGMGVRRVVERRLRNWEIQRKQGAAKEADDATAIHPYIALSRAEYPVARRVSASPCQPSSMLKSLHTLDEG